MPIVPLNGPVPCREPCAETISLLAPNVITLSPNVQGAFRTVVVLPAAPNAKPKFPT